METIISILIGLGVGVLVYNIVRFLRLRAETVGTLRIDTSDQDDNPYLFLELETDITSVRKKKYVTLKVNTINYIPRK